MVTSSRIQRVPLIEAVGPKKAALIQAPLPADAYTKNQWGKTSVKVEAVRDRLDSALGKDGHVLRRQDRDGNLSDWEPTKSGRFVQQWFVWYANGQPVDYVLQAVQVSDSVGAAAANLPAYAMKKIAFGDLVRMGQGPVSGGPVSGGPVSGGPVSTGGVESKKSAAKAKTPPTPASGSATNKGDVPPTTPPPSDAPLDEVLSAEEEFESLFTRLEAACGSNEYIWKKATKGNCKNAEQTRAALLKGDLDEALVRLRGCVERVKA